MKALQDILYRVPLMQVIGRTDLQVPDFFFDSRQVQPNSLFVAQKGTQTDGTQYIPDAVSRGARIVVTEQIPNNPSETVTWLQVKDADAALAYIAANYYDNPAADMQVVGVTGTNGKSTVTSLLHQLLSNMGYPAGLLGTLHVCIGHQKLPATHTTPDAKQLQGHLAAMRDAGCGHVFMEVSSHALAQARVHGLPFAGAVFTNLTHDHLDYHGTFDAYLRAKKLLFDNLPQHTFALVNADDRNGKVMVQNTQARILTYGLRNLADYSAKVLENSFEGLLLTLMGKDVACRLIGQFNALNLLTVVACACELGLPEEEVLLHASQLLPVDGRFQTLALGQHVTGIVDYAHTPDALKNTLQTIQEINRTAGRVLTVVGCGGNRDKSKRPQMALLAAQHSDLAIFTSDNPRDEDPAAILEEMLRGVPVSMRQKVMVITDRREAIHAASRIAQPNDVLLVAGKGHETYQEIRGQRLHFDDTEELRNAFQLPN